VNHLPGIAFFDESARKHAAATQQLAQGPRFVGGQIGMVGVLHTWGRNLAYHPHVHYVIPAGGVAPDGQTWLAARENFLLPVKALSRIFRAKFRDELRKHDRASLAEVPAEVWEKEWVVHCQPVGKALGALKYLAPYIFRVVISNNRILKLADGKVTFRYRTSDTGRLKTCTLPAEEFIRRFLQHVLPKCFVKVRYYGFLAPGCRQRLAALRQQLGCLATHQTLASEVEGGDEQDSEPGSSDVAVSGHTVLCPSCGRVMRRRSIRPGEARPRPRCPP
jgi:hypothetical protein